MKRKLQVCLKCGHEEPVFVISDKEDRERGTSSGSPRCSKCQSVMIKYKGE